MGYRKTTVLSLFGKVKYRRGYYHCPLCEGGFCPTDAEFGLENRQSPAATELLALAGVKEAFHEWADRSLVRMTGLLVSRSTVQRTTERVGQDVAERRLRGETFGPSPEWDWHRDARGQRVAYVSLDATGVAQQAKDHGKAEGRMPWVASVFNPSPKQEERRESLWEARYLSGLMSLEEIGQQLRVECQAVGLRRADVVIGLSDGGAGLENCLLEATRGEFREIHFILDFYHASEHLLEFGKQWIPGEAERTTQVHQWCHTLKTEGGESLLARLQWLDVSRRSEAVQETHRQLLGYIRKNLHRMDYPTYVARGWQIGSGVIESACKSVVGGRLKGPGMRWGEHGTQGMCHLRALYKSKGNLWAQYWIQRNAA